MVKIDPPAAQSTFGHERTFRTDRRIIRVHSESSHLVHDSLNVFVDNLVHYLGIAHHSRWALLIGGIGQEIELMLVVKSLQLARLCALRVSVSNDVLLHRQDNLVDQWVMQDYQVKKVLSVSRETLIFLFIEVLYMQIDIGYIV